MPNCIEMLPCDWLISNLRYQAIKQMFLIKWPVSVCVCVCVCVYIYIYNLIISYFILSCNKYLDIIKIMKLVDALN